MRRYQAAIMIADSEVLVCWDQKKRPLCTITDQTRMGGVRVNANPILFTNPFLFFFFFTPTTITPVDSASPFQFLHHSTEGGVAVDGSVVFGGETDVE